MFNSLAGCAELKLRLWKCPHFHLIFYGTAWQRTAPDSVKEQSGRCAARIPQPPRALQRQTAALSLDKLYLVERFSGQTARATMWATDNRNLFDHQKARALPVASRHVPEMNSVPAAVLTTNLSFSRVTHHRRSKYTTGGPSRN
jgi:hypothetical protein